MTLDAGLEICSYGSYYRVGESENQNLSFNSVIETAIALKTKTIRVWAGSKGSKEADLRQCRLLYDDARRIALIAAKEGIDISFEYHNRTLTDTCESAYNLIKEINLENVKIYWQPVYGRAAEDNYRDLCKLLPFVTNIHVFHWRSPNKERHLLSDGIADWQMYMNEIKKNKNYRYAMIEFVKDDKPENLLADAETLRKLIE
jgi:sugar phosphate isomerase/epimerase